MNDIPDFLLVANRDKPMAPQQAGARKPLVHSYSSLHAYDDICAYRYYRTYVVRDIKYIETPERRKGNQTHDALAYRIGGKPLPIELQHLEKYAAPLDGHGAKAEGKVAINSDGKVVDYFASDVFLRGALDVTIVKEDMGYILDWKDGKSRWVKRFELDVHAVLLKAKYPQLRSIRAQYCFTTEDKLSELYDCSDVRATWGTIQHIVQRITADMQRGEFEKKPNPLCHWCDVLDCKHNTKSNGNS